MLCLLKEVARKGGLEGVGKQPTPEMTLSTSGMLRQVLYTAGALPDTIISYCVLKEIAPRYLQAVSFSPSPPTPALSLRLASQC